MSCPRLEPPALGEEGIEAAERYLATLLEHEDEVSPEVLAEAADIVAVRRDRAARRAVL
jgi:hypothetical protein